MNWKSALQIGDLDDAQRLEVTCRTCGHVHYLEVAKLRDDPRLRQLYLDEVERTTICKARGCRSPVRMTLVRSGDASGFVGGMA